MAASSDGTSNVGRQRGRSTDNDSLEMTEITGSDRGVVSETQQTENGPRKSHYIGAVLALISSLAFSTFALFIKLTKTVPTFEQVLFRFQLQMLYSFPLMIYYGDRFLYPMQITKYLVLRGLTGGSAICCKFFAVRNMPLGDATALAFTSPVFTAILGFACLKESLSKFDILAAILSLAGITLIARPSFLFGGQSPDTLQLVATGIAILGAMLGACSIVLTRKLVGTLRPRVVVLYMALVGSCVAIGASLVTGETFKYPDCGTLDNWYLFLMGVLGYTGQMFQTKALSLEKAAVCSVIRTSDIVFTYILQMLFLNEPVNAFSMGGAALVVLCNVSIFVSQFLRGKRERH